MTELNNFDEKLDQLKMEHSSLDDRLVKLDRRRSISPEEHYEMTVIKKRKLALKDRILAIEGEFQ